MSYNPSPIFLNCFSRGGSNILWNVFLSHPHCCSPIDETLQIFGAGLRHATLAGYQVALLSRQPRLFDQWDLQDRRPISPRVAALIDRTLYRCKLKTLQDPEMRYKSEGVLYTQAEVENSRLVAKNNNSLVFLSDMFIEMYPDAYFFALVRHPLPLYESHLRRKTPPARSVERFAGYYNLIVDRMLADACRLPNYYLLRFEDLLADPLTSFHGIYQLAGLDPTLVRKLRFKAKPHLQANGSHATPYQDGRHYWFNPDRIDEFLEPQVNHYQVTRLPPVDRDALLALTEDSRASLAYQDDLYLTA